MAPYLSAQTIYWLGPDEWLVMAQAGTEATLEQAIRAAWPDDPSLAITDLSHAYTGLRHSGIRTATCWPAAARWICIRDRST